MSIKDLKSYVLSRERGKKRLFVLGEYLFMICTNFILKNQYQRSEKLCSHHFMKGKKDFLFWVSIL